MFRVILLCLLTCCSSFMPLKQSESIISEDHTQVVEKKTKENYYRSSSGYYYYGSTDLCSYDFIVKLTNYYVDQYNATFLSLSSQQTGQYVITLPSNVISVTTYNENTNEYAHQYYVTNVILRKTAYNGSFYYDFILSNSSPYDKQLNYRWLCHYNDINSKVLYVYGIQIFGTGLNVSGTNVGAWVDVTENGNSQNAFLYTCVNTKSQSYNDGYDVGYNNGYNAGVNQGYDAAYNNGYSIGYDDGEVAGYTTGYNTGVSNTIASGSEAMTIFAGIMDVAFIPVNVFFLMFNYEVFGINIAGFVSGLLTIAIVIILMRFIFGRKV